MISYRIVTTALGLILFALIFLLVRKGRLQEKFAVMWFLIGLLIALLGIFPTLVDRVGRVLGIGYPPVLLLVMGAGILLLQNLHLFICASRNEARLRELSQEVAVLRRLAEESRQSKEGREEKPNLSSSQTSSSA